MRLIKLFLVLSLLLTQLSCIRDSRRSTDERAVHSMEAPKVIRDTIIQVVILDTVDNTKKEVAQVERVVRSTPTSSSRRQETDNYDRSNSGFFDNYQQSYTGDPNRDLKPTTRVVSGSNADDLSRQSALIEKQINQLEKINKNQQDAQVKMNQEIDRRNLEAVEKAKQQQEAQKAQQKPKPKTLDTDLLLDRRK